MELKWMTLHTVLHLEAVIKSYNHCIRLVDWTHFLN